MGDRSGSAFRRFSPNNEPELPLSDTRCPGGDKNFDLYAIDEDDEAETLVPTSTPTSSPTPVLSDNTEQLAAPSEFQDLLNMHNEAR